MPVFEIVVHHSVELFHLDLGPQIDNITLKIGSVDVGVVNFNDSKILGYSC